MASSRLISAAAIAVLGFGAWPLWATGGDYDRVPYAMDYYLQRVPAKSVSQIYAELGAGPSTAKPIDLPRAELIRDFAQGPSAKLVQEIDELLAKSRSPYAGPTQMNLLQDLRDLAGSEKATGPEMSAYVKWRLDHLDLFKRADPDTSADKAQASQAGLPQIEAQTAKASAALQPHWLYLEGAILYKGGDDTVSEQWFDKVLQQFPNDARAESALFMKGRCKLSQSVKSDDYENQDGRKSDAGKKEEAKTLFRSYLTMYPKGRYTSDVIGWLGGVAFRSNEAATALADYTQQLEMKDHPENFGAALVMIEKVLARERPDSDATLDEVAQHPPVALALAYFALNFTQPKEEQEDVVQGDYETFNKWRHAVLPKLGRAVLAHQERYRGEAWQERYLAILAQAASDQGDQKQALELVAMGDKSTMANDDLLFAKALVLQRSGDLPSAEKTYRELLEKFPKSPLARGARYRFALVLHDEKRDGEALLELAALWGNQLSLHDGPAQAKADATADTTRDESSALNIDYSGAPDNQIAQTMDTLLNFAPLPELEKALAAATGKDQGDLRTDLGQVLKERYLDRDDFHQAARFADLPQVKKQWSELAEKSDAMEKATGPDAAKGRMELADFWVANRKMLPAMPLDSVDTRAFLLYGADAGKYRAANAAFFNYAHPEMELESREGLWHAIKWWDEASATHDPVVAPTALWSIIKARRTIAEVSPWTWQRAIDGQAGADSKGDYDLLMAKYPASPEAQKLAVYWDIPANYPRHYYERFSVGYDRDGLADAWLHSLGTTANNGNGYRDQNDYTYWQSIEKRVKGLVADAENSDAKTFTQRVTVIRDEVRLNGVSLENVDTVNCLDDLVQFSEVDGVAGGLRAAYVRLRVELLYGKTPEEQYASFHKIDLTGIRQQPGTENIRDFIDFLDLAQTAYELVDVPVPDLDKDGQPLTFTSRNYRELLPKTTAFLQKYPKSPKREAARLLQIRALVRASRPKEVPWTIDWPAANQWDDQYAPRFLTLAPFDKARVDAAFQAYADEFPHGQYAQSVLALRTDTALIQEHWGDALDDLLALLDQQTAPELHATAASELSYIFDQIDKDERRHDVLDAILKRPAARKNLTAYLNAGGLATLKDYLNLKLAAP